MLAMDAAKIQLGMGQELHPALGIKKGLLLLVQFPQARAV